MRSHGVLAEGRSLTGEIVVQIALLWIYQPALYQVRWLPRAASLKRGEIQ